MQQHKETKLRSVRVTGPRQAYLYWSVKQHDKKCLWSFTRSLVPVFMSLVRMMSAMGILKVYFLFWSDAIFESFLAILWIPEINFQSLLLGLIEIIVTILEAETNGKIVLLIAFF